MPELPDVEALRAAVERECQGRRLLRVELKEQGGGPREGLFDDAVFDKADEAEVKRAMEGKVLVSTGRKGKCMWIVLEEGGGATGKGKKKKKGAAASPSSAGSGGHLQQQQHVLLHMGMTGSLVVKGKDVPQYKAFSISAAAWPPKFTKAEFTLEGGVHLAYCDPRRWGRITLKADAPSEPPVSDLAPDAWTQLPDLATFQSVLRGLGVPLKALLLDQGKLVSGVGNWVADEICFQARVDPAKRCSALRDDEIEAIRTQTFTVCDTACKANADADGFPDHWLFHHRWANKAKGVKMPNGAAIVFETIGGRTTAIVPSVQRARGGGAGGGGKQKKKGRAVAAAADTEDEKQQDSKPAATPATTGGGRKRKAAAALATAATGVVAEEEKEKKPRNKRGKAAGSDENEEAGGSKLAAVVKQRGRGSKKRA